jgi:hypothetical protein
LGFLAVGGLLLLSIGLLVMRAEGRDAPPRGAGDGT